MRFDYLSSDVIFCDNCGSGIHIYVVTLYYGLLTTNYIHGEDFRVQKFPSQKTFLSYDFLLYIYSHKISSVNISLPSKMYPEYFNDAGNSLKAM